MKIFRLNRCLKLAFGFSAVTIAPSVAYFKYQGYDKDYFLLTLAPLRFGRAACAVLKIAFDYKYSLYGLTRGSSEYKEVLSKTHTRAAERLKELCMRNGGCYTKVGQHLGVLDHLIPFEYVVVMRTLHTYSTPSDIRHIHKVLKEEFKKETKDLFETFDEVPFASASLAQVHKARLWGGEDVVVKVQHPHVASTSKSDINSMQLIFKFITKLFGNLELNWLVEESRLNLPLELDFQHEAQNSQKASECFKNLTFLRIPRVYSDLTSKRVLTMEKCEGGFINDIKFYQDNNISIQHVIKLLNKLYIEMIFTKGYVHCDPHPGNILVSADAGHPTIYLLDHGLYKTFPDSLRLSYCRMWKAMLEGDEAAMKKGAEQMGVGNKYQLLTCILTGRSWQAVQNCMMTQYTEQEESEIRNTAPQLVGEITAVLNTIPRPFVFLLKTNDLIRGVCRSLNFKPDYATLLTTAKSCLIAIYSDLIERSHGPTKLWLQCAMWWHVGKLTIFTFYLHISNLIHL